MSYWITTAVVVFVGVFAAVVTYQWLRAELEERQWRRLLDQEMSEVPDLWQDVLRGDGSDRE